MWVTLTADHIFPRQAELAQIQSVKLPAGLTGDDVLNDELAQELSHVTGYLRSAVAKGYLSQLGPVGTVPQSLLGPVAVLVRRATLARLPGLEALHGKMREDEVSSAERTIRDVATGAHRVDEHALVDGETESIAVPLPSIAPRPHNYSREDQDGL